MAARVNEPEPRASRPPRAMAWVLVLASTVAVLVVGLVATTLIFGNIGGWTPPPAGFWLRLLVACGLTIASLALRSLRWIYLLRRAETRIPIRDAYIGYLAGFSLLFAPLLIGEAAVRAMVNRRRGAVPLLTTVVVNVWERLVDVVALATIVAGAALVLGQRGRLPMLAGGIVLVTLLPPVRVLILRIALAVLQPIARMFERATPRDYRRLLTQATWSTALSTSIVAWLLPGVGFWVIASTWPHVVGMADSQFVFAGSATTGAALLAPGGVIVAGERMLEMFQASGLPEASAVLAVLGIRLATAGVSTALGLVFLLLHMRTAPAPSDTHFDDIADAYDVQIPESRRHALLALKTGLMKQVLEGRGAGRHGLDVGCGQGAYVAQMRTLGFDVKGIDASAGQILLAGRNVGNPEVVAVGSVLNIPAADRTYDFLYIINVLHHLGSVHEQQRAFAELQRVLKPGGLLFVHEINTRNVLFRFYMGYVFPSLNCIDEGVERWLLPHRLHTYTDATVAEVRYFTFLPDFIPQAVARLLRPFERMLERSALGVYSAHYMAVLVKGESTR